MKKEVFELCPNCNYEVEMQWDIEADGYKAYCPRCGGRLMLCDECMHINGDYSGHCDYDGENDTCRNNKEPKPKGIDRLLGKDGECVYRICHYPENQVGNAPCYGCADRAKCNHDIFERLAAYEESGLSPEEIKALHC